MVFLCSAGLAFSGDSNPSAGKPLGLEELLSAMVRKDKERTASLRDYSCGRRYTLENKKFGVSAEIRARMTYRQPGTKTFEITSERGTKLIRDSVLRRLIKTELEAMRPEIRPSTQITPENYSFRLVGMETEQGQQHYVLAADPKRPNKYLFRGRVWVNFEDLGIARIEAAPAQNPSFWVKKTTFVHRYQKFGQVWLPVSNSSQSDVRIFGTTVVKVEYSDYRINQEQSGAKGVRESGVGAGDGEGAHP